ncbi:MAG: SIS domain-containing protein [Bacteroidota bacterium]|nr:SIS domain-containing protein [Bacteroidota bacterium]
MRVKQVIQQSIETKQRLLMNEELISEIKKISAEMVECFKEDGKVFFCGNGGSAADAQHLAAELSGRFYYDRDPLYSEALHVNSSYMTAVANDYSYDEVYRRMVKAVGREGDILVGISTSGNSKNIVNAIKQAKTQNMITVAFTGDNGGELKEICDFVVNVPSDDTPRIQEAHILVGHIICELVEAEIFPQK